MRSVSSDLRLPIGIHSLSVPPEVCWGCWGLRKANCPAIFPQKYWFIFWCHKLWRTLVCGSNFMFFWGLTGTMKIEPSMSFVCLCDCPVTVSLTASMYMMPRNHTGFWGNDVSHSPSLLALVQLTDTHVTPLFFIDASKVQFKDAFNWMETHLLLMLYNSRWQTEMFLSSSDLDL